MIWRDTFTGSRISRINRFAQVFLCFSLLGGIQELNRASAADIGVPSRDIIERLWGEEFDITPSRAERAEVSAMDIESPTVISIRWPQLYAIGSGYDAISGKARASIFGEEYLKSVSNVEAKPDPNVGQYQIPGLDGDHIERKLRYISDSESMCRSSSLGISAEISGLFASAEFGINTSSSISYSSTTVRFEQIFTIISGAADPRRKATQKDVNSSIWKSLPKGRVSAEDISRMLDFRREYGTHYIAGYIYGFTSNTMINYTAASESSKQALEISLKAKYGPLKCSGKYDESMAKACEHYKLDATLSTRGLYEDGKITSMQVDATQNLLSTGAAFEADVGAARKKGIRGWPMYALVLPYAQVGVKFGAKIASRLARTQEIVDLLSDLSSIRNALSGMRQFDVSANVEEYANDYKSLDEMISSLRKAIDHLGEVDIDIDDMLQRIRKMNLNKFKYKQPIVVDYDAQSMVREGTGTWLTTGFPVISELDYEMEWIGGKIIWNNTDPNAYSTGPDGSVWGTGAVRGRIREFMFPELLLGQVVMRPSDSNDGNLPHFGFNGGTTNSFAKGCSGFTQINVNDCIGSYFDNAGVVRLRFAYKEPTPLLKWLSLHHSF